MVVGVSRDFALNSAISQAKGGSGVLAVLSFQTCGGFCICYEGAVVRPPLEPGAILHVPLSFVAGVAGVDVTDRFEEKIEALDLFFVFRAQHAVARCGQLL